MSLSQDPYKYFRVEALELIEQLEQGVLGIEKGAALSVLVPKLLRHAHTLKGAARVVKQKEIGESAHAIEDVLMPFRDGAQAVHAEIIEQLLKRFDEIRQRVKALTPSAPPTHSTERGPDRPPPEAPEELFRTIRADVGEVDALLTGVSEASIQFNSMRGAFGALESAHEVAALLMEQLGAPRSRDVNGHEVSTVSERTKSLAEELGGILIGLERNLGNGADRLERELEQVRVGAEHLRLLPASTLFATLERTARDAAQTLGKRVAFEARGGEVRLDAHVLGYVHGALIQAVRNAVAHGIELEGDRSRGGKPLLGIVSVEVIRRGSRVTFRCRDDGRGIDRDAIREAAKKHGVPASEIEALAPSELLKFLFRGGLTTARTVSEVAGRGIGLDVIREAAAQLGAEVTLETEPQRGTLLEFTVPVSRSSFDTLVVEAGGIAGAIPLDSIKSTLRIRQEDIAHAPRGSSIVYQGRAIPFMPLAHSLSKAGQAGRDSLNVSAVVLDDGSRLAAVGVERLVGIENIMLRPLPRLALSSAIVAGASLDGEGNPQVIFDPAAVVAAVHRAESSSASAEEQARLPVLIVDDSLTTRMLEQSILESAGYEVDVATSGEEGLQKAKRRPYGFFLVDVEMPGMDGFTFLQQVRADPELSGVPAILVTSRNQPEDRRRGDAAGANGYMVKSEFDQEVLLRTIRKLMKRGE